MSAETTALVQFQFRFDPAADWLANDPVLLVGEPGVETDGNKGLKIGDGVRKWSALPYVGGVSVRSVNGKTGEVMLTSQDIPNLAAFIKQTIASTLVQGANVGLAYDQAAGKLTVSAAGGSGGGGGGSTGGVSSVNEQVGAVTLEGAGGISVTNPGPGTIRIGTQTGGSFTGTSAAPGAPTGVAGVAGDRTVTVSWTAPASTGTSPIASYTVQYSGDGGTAWSSVAAGTATSAIVSGLQNGTPYVFRVAASNSTAVGPFSEPSAPVTPEASGPSLTAITLSGNSYLAGSAAGYAVGTLGVVPAIAAQLSLPSGVLNNSQFAIVGGELVVPGVITSAVGTTRQVRIAATAPSGSITQDFTITVVAAPTTPADPTDPTQPGTPSDLPGTPGSLTLTPSHRSIAVQWAAAPDNGSPIDTYAVAWAPTASGAFVPVGDIDVTDGTNRYTISDVTPGTQYTVKVTANNAVGWGPPASGTTTTLTPVITISVHPQSVTATLQQDAAGCQATVSAVAAASDNSPVSYEWQSQKPGGQWTNLSSTGPEVTLTGLRFLTDNGTKVRVRVTSPDAVAVVSNEATITVPDAVWYAGAKLDCVAITAMMPHTTGALGVMDRARMFRTADGRDSTAFDSPGVGSVKEAVGWAGKGALVLDYSPPSGGVPYRPGSNYNPGGGGRYWSGDNGVTWSKIAYGAGVAAAGPPGFFVTIGAGSLTNPGCVWSADGLTWVTLPFDINTLGTDARFFVTATRILALSRWSPGPNVLRWKPAANPSAPWVTVALPAGLAASDQWLAAIEIGGLVYLFGRGSTYLVSNPGLTAWTQRAMPYADVFVSAAYGRGMLAVVGAQGQAAVSADPAAAAWKIEPLPTTNHTAVVFTGGRFIACGGNRLSIRDVAEAIATGSGVGGGVSVQPPAPHAPTGVTVTGLSLGRYTADAPANWGNGRVYVTATRTSELPFKAGDYRNMQVGWTAPATGPTPTEYVIEPRVWIGTRSATYPQSPIIPWKSWPWMAYPNMVPRALYGLESTPATTTNRRVFRHNGLSVGGVLQPADPAAPDNFFWKSGIFSRWDAYQFRVAAKNGTTMGPWSAWSEPFYLKGS